MTAPQSKTGDPIATQILRDVYTAENSRPMPPHPLLCLIAHFVCVPADTWLPALGRICGLVLIEQRDKDSLDVLVAASDGQLPSPYTGSAMSATHEQLIQSVIHHARALDRQYIKLRIAHEDPKPCVEALKEEHVGHWSMKRAGDGYDIVVLDLYR